MSYANKKRLEKLEGEDASKGHHHVILSTLPNDDRLARDYVTQEECAEEQRLMAALPMTEREWEAEFRTPERRQ